MAHHIFAVDMYSDTYNMFKKEFHHKPYKDGRYYSRVRELTFLGVFRWLNFTIEEEAEREFMADMRCFFNNDLVPYWQDRRDKLQGKQSLFQRIWTLDFYPFSAWKLEEKSTDKIRQFNNKREHFKKWAAYKFFMAAFISLRLFGFTRPHYQQRSFVRDSMLEGGKSFLCQGFYVGKIADRKVGGIEYIAVMPFYIMLKLGLAKFVEVMQ